MVPAVVFVTSLGLILWGMGSGLDFGDEGFALLAARHPDDVRSVTNFACYTGVLHSLAGGSVWGLRALGMFVLLSVTAALAFAAERALPWGRPQGSLSRVAFACTVGCAALGLYSNAWIPSPAYNWLCSVGLTLAFAALLLWNGAELPRGMVSAGALFGVAFGLTFMARPPSAPGLGLLGTAWVGLMIAARHKALGDLRWPLIGSVLGLACFLGLHFLCFKGPAQSLEDLSFGLAAVACLGGHEGALTRVFSDLSLLAGKVFEAAPIWWSVAGVAGAIVLWRPGIRRPPAVAWTVALLALAVELGARGAWRSQSVVVSGLALGAVYLGAVHRRSEEGATWRQVSTLVLVAGVLAGGALVGSYGSNARLHDTAGRLAVFPVVGGLWALASASRSSRAVFQALVSVSIALALLAGLSKPYRLAAPVWEQTRATAIEGASLRLDPPTAAYLERLRSAADASGFVAGTVLIDLTGYSPGVVFALGGRSPGTPWLLGGYSGSADFAVKMLEQSSPEELNRAWLLTSDDPARRLPASVLTRVGLSFPEGYAPVVRVRQPDREGEYTLWRPK